jgi:hypothetical protein
MTILSDMGEQVSLRQFDISDRTRDRVTAIVQVAPVESIGLNGSVGTRSASATRTTDTMWRILRSLRVR